MLRMNSVMLKAYDDLLPDNIELDNDLREIVEAGFVGDDGCYLLKKYLEIGTNVSFSDFPDKTGYECFINSVNIDDYVKDNYLAQGLCFVRNILSRWNEFQDDEVLMAILSLDELGSKVKFHTLREGEQWLADELDEYEEAILLVDSSEMKFINSESSGDSLLNSANKV